jgi:hypothetical protein
MTFRLNFDPVGRFLDAINIAARENPTRYSEDDSTKLSEDRSCGSARVIPKITFAQKKVPYAITRQAVVQSVRTALVGGKWPRRPAVLRGVEEPFDRGDEGFPDGMDFVCLTNGLSFRPSKN